MVASDPLAGLRRLHLSYVSRWVVAPTHRHQSVAEHSYRVTIIAAVLRRLLTPDTQNIIDEFAMVTMALVHDDDEIMSGDIPGPSKDGNPRLKPHEMDWEAVIVKVADCIETGTFWVQWGNPGAWTGHPYNRAPKRDIDKIRYYAPEVPGLIDAAQSVWRAITGYTMEEDYLVSHHPHAPR